MPYHLVSFDLDGTLVDTAGEIAEAANRTLAEYGLPQASVPHITGLVGRGAHALMRRLLAQMVQQENGQPRDAPAEPAVLASFDRHYADTAGTTSQPYPGVTESLAALRAASVRVACVTNKEMVHTRRVLALHRLDGLFDLVVAGDTLAQKKPHADVLGHVLRHLGCEAGRSAHVGDSRIDLEAARNAGVAAWAVPYGYNEGVPIAQFHPERLFDSIADACRHALAPRP